LLILSAIPVTFMVIRTNSVNAQSASCPPDKIFRFTDAPIPSGFNFLSSPPGGADFDIAGMLDMSLTPFHLGPNAALYWKNSVTDWFRPNADYTEWTFHIKSYLKWSDGDSVTSHDILAWLSPSYALNSSYDFIGLHSEIVKETEVNSTTFVLTLNTPDAHIIEKLTSYYYAPPVAPELLPLGPADNLFGSNVVDGPYYIANYTSGATTMVMLPNPYFVPKPVACEVVVTFVEGATSMLPIVVGGQTDLSGQINYLNAPTLQNRPNIHLTNVGDVANKCLMMLYNVTRYPYNMTQFRQALAYAINGTQIASTAYGTYGVSGNRAQGLVSPLFPAYNPHQQYYDYNPATSLQLLHSIGFTGGGDAGPLLMPNGTMFKTTIWTTVDRASDIEATSITAQNLQALGMDVVVQNALTHNLIGDYFSNGFNIDNNIIITMGLGSYYGEPWLDAQPQCNVIFFGCLGYQSSHWIYPPSADAQYQSNLSAILKTADPAQEQIYLNNIQALNAKYLPMMNLVYLDQLFAYNTARWTNWPAYNVWPGFPNMTMFATVTPVSAVTTSSASTQSTVMTSTQTSTQTATTGVTTTATSVTVVTSTAGAVSNDTLTLVVGAVVVVVVIAAVAAFALRRRRPTGGT
jgi:ABC-type transport system substrate-binding protein